MAGLSDFTTTSSTEATTLPSWYSSAQENLTGQALTAAAPAVGTTAGQAAVSTFAPGNVNNPFAQGQNVLNTIGSGAANPWITTTDASGNLVTTGNPNTAMGGLFNAQTGYLNQIMPNVAATPEATNIGTGNFGSLRGMTAVNKAKADALANLFQQQNAAALQNQQAGVQAGTGLSTIGAQGTQAALNTGTFQLEEPTKGLIGQANIINNLKPGTTVTKTGTLSPLNQIGSLASLSTGVLDALFGKPAAGTATTGLLDQIANWYAKLGYDPSKDVPAGTTTPDESVINNVVDQYTPDTTVEPE